MHLSESTPSPLLIYTLSVLSMLTEAMYSTVLPSIAWQMGVDGSVVQLSTTSYYCGFSLGILTMGRFSDIYGRRLITLLGLCCYITGTYLIIQSSSIGWFISYRFMQAYGASIGSVISQAIARDSYNGRSLSQIYLNTSILMGLLPTIGVTIGGYIVDIFHIWQYIFVALLLYASFICCLHFKFLPETNRYLGHESNGSFSSVMKAAFKDRIFISYAIIIGILNGNYFSFFIQAPFVFIDNLAISPSLYGILFGMISMAMVISSLLTKYMINRYVDITKVQIIGFALSIVGAVMLIAVTSFVNSKNIDVNYYIACIFIPISIQSFGYAMVVPTILSRCLDNYRKVLGSAGSILGSTYYGMTAITTFLVARVYSQEMAVYSRLFGILILIATALFAYVKKLEKQQQSKLI